MGRIIRVPIHPLAPSHLGKPRFLHRMLHLQAWATGIRGQYGVPVWLVGSALREGNRDPRDWDVRLCLPRRDFEMRYGSVSEWIDTGASGDWGRCRWRWADEMVKKTKEAWERTDLNIDFQVYPVPHWYRFRKLPRMPLDTRWAGLS